MQIRGALLFALSLSGTGLAATLSGASGYYTTHTYCRTVYATTSATRTPVPTTLYHNTTTPFKQSTALKTTTRRVDGSPTTVTVKETETPYVYSGTTTFYSTLTSLATVASPATTVTVPIPRSFVPAQSFPPPGGFQKRATTTTAAVKYPKSVLCTDKVTFSASPHTTYTTTTRTIVPTFYATKTVTASTTATYQSTAYGVRIATKTVQPTSYPACQANNFRTTYKKGLQGADLPINSAEGNGELDRLEPAYGETAAVCCARCAERPDCFGAVWTNVPDESQRCAIAIGYGGTAQCFNSNAIVYNSVPSNTSQPGDVVVSNGPCGMWVSEQYAYEYGQYYI